MPAQVMDVPNPGSCWKAMTEKGGNSDTPKWGGFREGVIRTIWVTKRRQKLHSDQLDGEFHGGGKALPELRQRGGVSRREDATRTRRTSVH